MNIGVFRFYATSAVRISVLYDKREAETEKTSKNDRGLRDDMNVAKLLSRMDEQVRYRRRLDSFQINDVLKCIEKTSK